MFPWHQYLLAVIFLIAGFMHFKKPNLYLKIMPPYIPSHKLMVIITGVMEMIFGFMLITQNSQKIAAWGIIGLLILFIPVHIYMLQNKNASLGVPKWGLVLRIPLQFGLIYWAFQYV